jgi:RNase adaptor protein for sRNA GlmZ degradation
LKKVISFLVDTQQSEKQYLNISVVSFPYKNGFQKNIDIVYYLPFITNFNNVYELKYKINIDKSI